MHSSTSSTYKPLREPLQVDQTLHELTVEFSRKFTSCAKRYALFHFAFLGIGLVQAALFLFFFPSFQSSSSLAFLIASFLFSAFSYVIVFFYFQIKKPQQFMDLKDWLQEKFDCSPISSSCTLAQLALYCGFFLQTQEKIYYKLPFMSSWISLWAEKLTLCLHWKDLLMIEEMILRMAVEDQVKIIQEGPLNIEAHMTLASLYKALSQLYLDPKKNPEKHPPVWTSKSYGSSSMQARCQFYLDRALEELKVVNELSSEENTWAHLELARLYRITSLVQEEIREYEVLQKLLPRQTEILFHLGSLYFEQGLLRKGLEIYHQIKSLDEKKAYELIQYYDAHHASLPSFF